MNQRTSDITLGTMIGLLEAPTVTELQEKIRLLEQKNKILEKAMAEISDTALQLIQQLKEKNNVLPFHR